MDITKIFLYIIFISTPLAILYFFIYSKKLEKIPKSEVDEENLIKFLKRSNIDESTKIALHNVGWDDITINQSVKYIFLEKRLISYMMKARFNDMNKKDISDKLISLGWDKRIVNYLIRKYYI